jgi:hypothetical protein
MEMAVAATRCSIITTLKGLSPILPVLIEAGDDAMFGCGIAVAGGAFMTSGATLIFS